ncbi:MAG: sugar kinase [Bacteroidales bacterium]|nr:sugar kinase [Bacteroidales bacterium]
MNLRQNANYSLLAPTSMGLRITPLNRQPVALSDLFRMQATSAESNVLSIAASLGLPVKILTAFVKNSPMSQWIQRDLRSRNIAYEGAEIEQGGPWGFRHQLNIADSGFGMRAPYVYNDRAGEIGRTLSAKDFDFERIFAQEGTQILHISGLVAALSPDTGEFCKTLAQQAKKHGSIVSFDLNYRASFWLHREKELYDIFHQIASLSDILIGNEEEFQKTLHISEQDIVENHIIDRIDSFKKLMQRVREKYPCATMLATTLRQEVSANEHWWGAMLLHDDVWTVIEPRQIPVLDRIGGGDGFVGGLLYGILKGWNPERSAQFGWACGAYVVTLLNDFGTPANEDEIWNIWKGNARVKR